MEFLEGCLLKLMSKILRVVHEEQSFQIENLFKILFKDFVNRFGPTYIENGFL